MTANRTFAARTRSIAPAVLALGVAGASLIGCSSDTHTYRSTYVVPKTVGIAYVETGETIWAMDVPAGQNLTLEFDRDGQVDGFRTPAVPATEMEWYTTPLSAKLGFDGAPSKGKSLDSGVVELTGRPVKINVLLRPRDTVDDLPVADTSLEVEPIDEPPAPPAEVLEGTDTDFAPAEIDPATEDAASDMDSLLEGGDVDGGVEMEMLDMLEEDGTAGTVDTGQTLDDVIRDTVPSETPDVMDAGGARDQLEVLEQGLEPGSEPIK